MALFEKAVAIDPSFAMAFVKMAVIESNLGNLARRNQYRAEALKLANHLTPRDHAYIEAVYYQGVPAATAKTIAAYERCISIDPTYDACRNNLALQYNGLERYAEAVAQFEPLVQAGIAIINPYLNIAVGYRALGQPEKAVATMEGYARRNPENPSALGPLGAALTGTERLDDAVRVLDKARLLDPTDPGFVSTSVTTHLLREDWSAARTAANTLARFTTEVGRWNGAQAHSALNGFLGRSAEGVTWAERAAQADKANGSRSSVGYQLLGLTLLARGQNAAAVAALTKAVAEGKGTPEEPTGLPRPRLPLQRWYRRPSRWRPCGMEGGRTLREASWPFPAATRPPRSSRCRTRRQPCPREGSDRTHGAGTRRYGRPLVRHSSKLAVPAKRGPGSRRYPAAATNAPASRSISSAASTISAASTRNKATPRSHARPTGALSATGKTATSIAIASPRHRRRSGVRVVPQRREWRR